MKRWVPWAWGWASVVLLGCTEVLVQPTVYPEHVQGLTVSGQGEVTARPDVGVMRLGVEVRDADVRRAVAEVSKRMSLILSNLEAQGVERSDLQTRDFSIHFEQAREPRPAPLASEGAERGAVPAAPRGAGASSERPRAAAPAPPSGYYRVTHGVQVLVRDVARAGDLLAVAMEHGANQMWGIEFRLEDPAPLEAKARRLALEDAFAKARALAQASGLQLGRVLSMHDSAGGGGGPVVPFQLQRAAESSVPIEAGEVAVRQNISVTFALDTALDTAPAASPAAASPAAEARP